MLQTPFRCVASLSRRTCAASLGRDANKVRSLLDSTTSRVEGELYLGTPAIVVWRTDPSPSQSFHDNQTDRCLTLDTSHCGIQLSFGTDPLLNPRIQQPHPALYRNSDSVYAHDPKSPKTDDI